MVIFGERTPRATESLSTHGGVDKPYGEMTDPRASTRGVPAAADDDAASPRALLGEALAVCVLKMVGGAQRSGGAPGALEFCSLRSHTSELWQKLW